MKDDTLFEFPRTTGEFAAPELRKKLKDAGAEYGDTVSIIYVVNDTRKRGTRSLLETVEGRLGYSRRDLENGRIFVNGVRTVIRIDGHKIQSIIVIKKENIQPPFELYQNT